VLAKLILLEGLDSGTLLSSCNLFPISLVGDVIFHTIPDDPLIRGNLNVRCFFHIIRYNSMANNSYSCKVVFAIFTRRCFPQQQKMSEQIRPKGVSIQ
jgi:hypothetical protein